MGAMRRARASPPTPDCRGGVFAVFAKISPPVLAAFRGYGVDAVFLGRDAARHVAAKAVRGLH